ncbi:tryptophan synthase alpha chain, partial [Achromatium sp. WMS3]
MSRITECFAKLKSQGKTVLIPFITAGDPQPEVTVPLMQELVTSGADILELGIPFSDPMADGPVIQKANERALANGMTLRDCLDLVHNFRTVNTQTPIILMGYLNPIEVMGYNNFAQQALLAGVDGVITVDIPPEESAELLTALRSVAIDSIYLIAPTSTPERIQRICAVARGFVYYVSMRGVTGALHLDLQEVTNRLNIIRKLTTLPIGVGF